MLEVIFNTPFDGSEISFLISEQALFFYKNGQIATQIKDYNFNYNWRYLNYCNDKDFNNIYHSKVIDNAINVYGIDLQIHSVNINPNTYNILYINNIDYNYKNIYKFIDKISKFNKIIVAEEKIKGYINKIGIDKNVFVAIPNIYIEKQDIKQNNIMCCIPKNGESSFFVFLEAYFQIQKFKDKTLSIFSENLVGNSNLYDKFINKIKNLKNKYKVKENEYKIQLLYKQTPNNIKTCIINSELLIFPYTGDNGYSFISMYGSIISKPIVLTSYSCMAKYILNCDIIMDLPIINKDIPENKKDKAILIWKMFLNELDINKETLFINKNKTILDLFKKGD